MLLSLAIFTVCSNVPAKGGPVAIVIPPKRAHKPNADALLLGSTHLSRVMLKVPIVRPSANP